MWTLFSIVLTLWIFSKLVLNIFEIFVRCEERAAHLKWSKDLQNEIASTKGEISEKDED
jgi:hypothetical protein